MYHHWTLSLHEFNQVGFEVLTTASRKMAVFWIVAPCSLVEIYRCSRGACFLNHQGDHG
jgi:hypothetical protein